MTSFRRAKFHEHKDDRPFEAVATRGHEDERPVAAWDEQGLSFLERRVLDRHREAETAPDGGDLEPVGGGLVAAPELVADVGDEQPQMALG